MYYYHDGENEVGPLDADKLHKLASIGLIGSGTVVRAAHSSLWVAFSQLDAAPPSDATAPVAAAIRDVADEPLAAGQGAPRVSSFGWLASPPTPWRRYAARTLDTTLNGVIMLTLFAIAFYAIAPASADEFFQIFATGGGRVLDILLSTAAASILSGMLIGVSGLTLGKWIFGVRVTRPDETKMGIGPALVRDFSVLFKGLGMGIPIVGLLTLWFSYRRLRKHEATTWDEGRYVVWHRPSGSSQYLLNVVGILLILLILTGVSLMSVL